LGIKAICVGINFFSLDSLVIVYIVDYLKLDECLSSYLLCSNTVDLEIDLEHCSVKDIMNEFVFKMTC